MAVLDLMQEAKGAGLTVVVDGGELVIRGPRRLADLARRLIERKADVLAALRQALATSADDDSTAQPASGREVTSSRSKTHRMIGNGCPAIQPAAILATPAVLCPRCGLRPVLRELRQLTRGRCYDCWTNEKSPAARSSPRSDVPDSAVDGFGDAAEQSESNSPHGANSC